MPSRFLLELGYNPYGSSQDPDLDGDGFSDAHFANNEFDDDFDPFPPDLPVFE